MKPLIDRQGMQETTGLAKWQINLLMHITQLTSLEKRYKEVGSPQSSSELLDAIYSAYNIDIAYDNEELKRQIPETGAFITVSNHPFGFIDGTTLLKEVSAIRPGYKVVANFLLAFFVQLADLFITVNPFENAGPRRMGGAKKSLSVLKTGNGVGLFPAGEISTWYKGQKGIQDKEWSLSSMKLILQAGVPVVPVYFVGTNSKTFHFLGQINPIFRTLRIAIEYLKKKNQCIRFKTGQRIEFDQIKNMTPEALRDFLRQKTYELQEK